MPMQESTISTTTTFEWSEEKNQWLAKNRLITFEEIVGAIKAGKLLYQGPHPNKVRYAHQYVVVVEIEDYAYLIPFVWKKGGTAFLKTVMPSRKMTKKYL
jgi:hypothetical protein